VTRVLVIDDEPQILRALRINLSVRGYDVSVAATGAEALKSAAEHKPDVVILDLGLPDMSGIDVLAGLRGWLTAPVIVLSARTDSMDKVEALDAGADDYVTKPFGMDEFLARLRAAVRRGAAASETDEPVVETSSFTVDLAAKRVTRSGVEVHLTPTEWGCWRCWCATAASSWAARSCSKRCGVRPMPRRPTIYGCISRNCAASSRSTRHTPNTC